ncbi:MAG TPA: SGNH hydrolase domain-containing protein, partial [Ilumatobacteraceae bacterium]
YVYQWLLPLVSVLSLVAVLAVVHPAARGTRRIFSMTALVEIGKRSYGIYLWHWPIFVVLGATKGAVAPVVVGLLITAVVSEACYRFVETPIRKGALSRWRAGGYRNAAPAWALAVLVGGLALFYVNVQPFDAAAGGEEVAFELEAPGSSVPATSGAPSSAPTGAVVDPVAPTTSAPPAAVASTTLPVLPRHITVVGDSQAHSLAINLPDGIDDTFAITDGSLDGCSVYDSGRVRSARDGFSNSFAMCEGWQDEWASAASGADVALVVLGAWDVFDMEDDGTTYQFGTPQADAHFTSSLQSGIDALKAAGAHVALLEVACMRPQDVEGAGVPALPERGDDARVAHVNELLRSVAAADPASVTFVDGPDAWCNDEAIATDLGHRWDGVHVYKPGANLIYETIAPALLAIPV